MTWQLAAYSTVAADFLFLICVKRYYLAPVWYFYAIPRLLLNFSWAAGLWWAVRSPWITIPGLAMRVAVTLEAIAILLYPPWTERAGARARGLCALSAGAACALLLHFSAQSAIGRVRIACTIALGVSILFAFARPLSSSVLYRRHILMMLVFQGSAAMASATGVRAGEPGDGLALVVQAACVLMSSWILTR